MQVSALLSFVYFVWNSTCYLKVGFSSIFAFAINFLPDDHFLSEIRKKVLGISIFFLNDFILTCEPFIQRHAWDFHASIRQN
jgi:hypothetical protein